MNLRKTVRRTLRTAIVVFVLMNVVAAFHAYKFMHFTDSSAVKTKDSKHISALGKAEALLFGISNPRPVNKSFPQQPYETVVLNSNKKIECWSIKEPNAKGTVIVFHGYGGEKSGMLDKSDEFLNLGYNTFLVDFMGSGNSGGNCTTIGWYEAEEVKSACDYVQASGEKNIYLFGTSMGASAVLKSIHDYSLNPSGIIIECPYGSLYQSTCARFKSTGVPPFPMAALLDFWGGVENHFWAFSLKPTEYAKSVKCPALLLYGERDEKVSRMETDEIFSNLQGAKTMKTFPLAAHENYLTRYKEEWITDVAEFLSTTEEK